MRVNCLESFNDLVTGTRVEFTRMHRQLFGRSGVVLEVKEIPSIKKVCARVRLDKEVNGQIEYLAIRPEQIKIWIEPRVKRYRKPETKPRKRRGIKK